MRAFQHAVAGALVVIDVAADEHCDRGAGILSGAGAAAAPDRGEDDIAIVPGVADVIGLMALQHGDISAPAHAHRRRRLRRLDQMGHADAVVSMNVSPREMTQFGVARLVMSTLAEFGLPPGMLEIELTTTPDS